MTNKPSFKHDHLIYPSLDFTPNYKYPLKYMWYNKYSGHIYFTLDYTVKMIRIKKSIRCRHLCMLLIKI